MTCFEPGAVITEREVWHGRVWLEHPVRVASDDGEPRHWYVNFERPVARTTDGIDTDDLELDLVVEPDGTRTWKDVEQLHARLAEGRFSLDDLAHVLAAAAEISGLLDRDERWWSPWDDWRPVESP